MLDEVKALSVDERRRLREILDTLLSPPSSPQPESKLDRVLLQAGLMSEIKSQGINTEAYRQYKPVQIKDKPVSETIIEERR
jgi:hypothetical protein